MVRSKILSFHLYTSPFNVPLKVMLSSELQTHKIVCKSPFRPKTPRFEVNEFPHKVQNFYIKL